MFQDPNMAGNPWEYETQEAKIARMLKHAAMLRGQSAQQPQGQMVSGHYVAPSWTQQLLPLLGNVMANRQEAGAEQAQQDLSQMQTRDANKWMQQMPQTRQVPFQAPGIDEQDAAAASFGNTVTREPTYQERFTHAGMGLRNPLTKTMAAMQLGELAKEPERVAAREERTQAREDRRADVAAGREMQERQAELTRELQRQIAAGNISVREAQVQLQREMAAARTQQQALAAADRAQRLEDTRLNRQSLDDDRAFRQANTLRDDYTKATQKQTEAQFQAKQVLNTIPNLNTMNAQQQMAVTYAFMRMLDPGSVVRESEYAMAERSRGVLDQLSNLPEQLRAGKRLTPTQVAQMQQVAQDIITQMDSVVKEKQGYFVDIARRYRLDPGNVIPGYMPAAGAPEGAVRPRGATSPATTDFSLPPPGAVRPRGGM
jgi:hypothetical protein